MPMKEQILESHWFLILAEGSTFSGGSSDSLFVFVERNRNHIGNSFRYRRTRRSAANLMSMSDLKRFEASSNARKSNGPLSEFSAMGVLFLPHMSCISAAAGSISSLLMASTVTNPLSSTPNIEI